MDLVNQTPVAAHASVAEYFGVEHRVGLIVAKATFRFDGSLDTQAPLPIWFAEQPTELGVLPRDTLPRRDSFFEVIVLGVAHAPVGKPVTRMRVRVRVGKIERELEVIGDRAWVQAADAWSATEPAAFTHMPLVWERAFGGSCEVAIDKDALVMVSDPFNRAGRGFDAHTMARLYAEAWGVPAGYPIVLEPRLLPNVEDPTHLVATPEDAPRAACWATLPGDAGLRAAWIADASNEGRNVASPELIERSLFNAHPDWIIERPKPKSEVLLEGLSPESRVAFALPELRVLADYVVGPRRGCLELAPQTLVLLPEERRFYLVYRAGFRVEYAAGVERGFRLRLEGG